MLLSAPKAAVDDLIRSSSPLERIKSKRFYLCVIGSSGGMGPQFLPFLLEFDERAKVAGCLNTATLPGIEPTSTWNIRAASTHWDAGLSTDVASWGGIGRLEPLDTAR